MNRMGPLRRTQLDAASIASAEVSAFIPLDGDRLRAALDRQSVGAGCPNHWDARVVATTSSTNSDLLREARGGHAFTRPVLLAAEIQTAGRGRLGRTWHSAPGASLTVSYALRVARRLAELEGISLVCGLAVRDALLKHGVRAELKWPNDVLVDARKLAGILVEAHALASSTIVIVGIGINVLPGSSDRAGGDRRALPGSDLRTAGWMVEDRNELAADLALALEKRLARFAETGFPEFASEWNAADALRDSLVSLGTTPGEIVTGFERGVDRSGGLLIEIDGTRKRFIAGDLSLRAIGLA